MEGRAATADELRERRFPSWLLGLLPLLSALAWWWSRRPPTIDRAWLNKEAVHEHQ